MEPRVTATTTYLFYAAAILSRTVQALLGGSSASLFFSGFDVRKRRRIEPRARALSFRSFNEVLRVLLGNKANKINLMHTEWGTFIASMGDVYSPYGGRL
jgi:hypothetical protein